MRIINEKNASVFTVLNAVLWGSSYIWSKMLLGALPYFTILFFYSIGGLIMLSIIFTKQIKSIGKKTVVLGAAIGGLSILSNVFCMLSLSATSSSNTAFIVQMSVIMTPLIMSAAMKKMPDKMTIISALTAFAGVFLLTFDFGSLRFNIGDFFALINALFFSLYLVALRIFAGKTNPVQFTFVQHIASTVVFIAMMLIFDSGGLGGSEISLPVIGILLLSILISVSTILIQSNAIKFVSAEKAAIIYTIEPVAAAVLAYIIIGERMSGINTFAGCILILAAVMLEITKKREIIKIKKTHRDKPGRNKHEPWPKEEIISIIFVWTKDKKVRSINRGY